MLTLALFSHSFYLTLILSSLAPFMPHTVWWWCKLSVSLASNQIHLSVTCLATFDIQYHISFDSVASHLILLRFIVLTNNLTRDRWFTSLSRTIAVSLLNAESDGLHYSSSLTGSSFPLSHPPPPPFSSLDTVLCHRHCWLTDKLNTWNKFPPLPEMHTILPQHKHQYHLPYTWLSNYQVISFNRLGETCQIKLLFSSPLFSLLSK